MYPVKMYILQNVQRESKSKAVLNITRGQRGVFKHACPQ